MTTVISSGLIVKYNHGILGKLFFLPVNNLTEAMYSIYLKEERVEKAMELQAKMMKASI